MIGADPEQLARRLGHEFASPALFIQALTHRSAGASHYERLEFLGDAVLSLVIAAELHMRRPRAPEGDLSRLRSSLVRERTLAQIATEWELGAYLNLGAGETRSGGFRRASILADAVEALIGAVYLDAGFEPARDFVLRLYAERLQDLPNADSLKDPKTRLQEWLQARNRPLPHYEVLQVTGEAHNQKFTARCTLADTELSSEGEGAGRRRAEQAAAQKMLDQLNDG